MKNTVQSALVFHYYSTLRLDNNILMKTKGINSPGFHLRARQALPASA
jgi:hypothetical protein